MYKVSIVVPVYNVEIYLNRCLNSLVNQDYKNIEIIIVNDGSPDNSQMIIDKYKKEYSNVIKAFTKKNEGLSEARNFGLKKATGDYVVFIDSDDYVETNMISEMIKCASKNNSDIVVCDIFDEYENEKIVKIYKNAFTGSSSIFEEHKILLNRFSAWNKLFKISLFSDKKLKFEKGKIYEDLRLILKLYLKTNIISFIKKPLYHYVIRDGSIMTSSGLKKNLDIVSAFDDVIEYYKQEDKYEMFKNELEFLAIDHLLISPIVRVLYMSTYKEAKRNALPYLKYIKKEFPNYKNNIYISLLSKNKKIILFLINHNKFVFLKFLIDLRRKK